MYQRVRLYIQNQNMLERKDKVITGISGGADSVCLLFVLIELKKEMDIDIVAVHVNHGLRGTDADADEMFVRTLCEEQGVELRVYHEDVRGYAGQWKISLEEAGREVRREVLSKALQECRGTKIALAHHRNDNAETMLWNLCRGTGLQGMGGIAPADGKVIRPLLCTDRREIESYLEKRGISYCTDETNMEDTYTRNRIRHHVIPYMERELNAQTVSHMAETAAQMRAIGAYIKGETARYLEKCLHGNCLMEEEYRKIPEALKSFVLHETLNRMAGKSRDLDAVHVRLLQELMGRQTGKEIHLPYAVAARRDYRGIVFEKREERKENRQGNGDADGDNQPAVRMRVFARTEDMTIFPEKTYTKWFDYDIIKNTVKIRHRISGDYITISQNGGRQKLKQYFINEKIPQNVRDEIWLAADGLHVMWIVGYRQNQAYQVTDHTKNILEIEFYGGQRDGREC